jgi:L-alanine-DL-glutamate epimerase-like enolase superfamily enzyme
MRITEVEAYLIHDRFVLVRVRTDEGLEGWGEATFHGGALTHHTVMQVGADYVGQDPFATDVLWWDAFTRGYRVGHTGAYTSAIGAIDIALHDIKGRALGVPIWSLLGGQHRTDVPLYASLLQRGLPVEENVERVGRFVSAGYRSVKVHTAQPWTVARDVDDTLPLVAALRNAFGGPDQLEIMVDVNHAYDRAEAIRVGRALEELQVQHFEEPLDPWDLDGYRHLARTLDVPIAAGEQAFSLWSFRDLVLHGEVDILQPNLTSCGGYTEGMRVAALAQAFGRPLVCHNTEPTLMTLAHLHFWAAARCCDRPQEYLGEPEHPLRDLTPILTEPLTVEEGRLRVPTGPGLGVDVDVEAIETLAAPR